MTTVNMTVICRPIFSWSRQDESDWGEDGEKENRHEKGDRVEAVVAAAVDCHFQCVELVLGNQIRHSVLFVWVAQQCPLVVVIIIGILNGTLIKSVVNMLVVLVAYVNFVWLVSAEVALYSMPFNWLYVSVINVTRFQLFSSEAIVNTMLCESYG